MAEIDLNKYQNAKILLVGDNDHENKTILEFIKSDGFIGFEAKGQLEAVAMFESRRPVVVIAAFDNVEDSKQLYLKLKESCASYPNIKHRTLLLCKSNQAEKAFALCQAGIFDDYVISRPLQDPFRLRLSFYAALMGCSTQAELQDRTQQMDNLDKNIKVLADLMKNPAITEEPLKTEVIQTLSDFSQKLAQESEGFKDYLSIKSRGQEAELPACQSVQLLELNLLSLNLPLIMLVEDDKAYRNILTKVFPPAQYNLIEANDGLHALELLATYRPNLIFLDLMMPNLNGIETLKRIRANKDIKGIPVVMLAGANEKDIVTDCIRNGAVDYIVKPGSRKVIMQKLVTHLKH